MEDWQWLRDAAFFVTAITVIFTGLYAFFRSPPMKWLGQQLMDEFAVKLGKVISDGIQSHHKANVQPSLVAIQRELVMNGGGSLRDEVVVIRGLVLNARDERVEIKRRLEHHQEHVNKHLIRIDTRLATIEQHHAQLGD